MIEELHEPASNLISDDSRAENLEIHPAEGALAFFVALGTSFVVRNTLRAGWRTALKSDPPKDPASTNVAWKEALLWGAVSGAVIGMSQIASRRASSAAYQRLSSRD